MPLYFFDTRDDDHLVKDDIGSDVADLEAVKAQAAMSLAELAQDVLPGSSRRVLTVEVRDERGPVLVATLTFAAMVLAR